MIDVTVFSANSLILIYLKKFKLISEHAYRTCSSNGVWLDENGLEQTRLSSSLGDSASPPRGWTNFSTCFSPELTQIIEGFYSNTTGELPNKYKNKCWLRIVFLKKYGSRLWESLRIRFLNFEKKTGKLVRPFLSFFPTCNSLLLELSIWRKRPSD